MAELSAITLAQFWSKVKVGDKSECWPWQAKTNEHGYGYFKDERAHRVAYEILLGEIPQGMVACHRCDNRLCCNPFHIFIGTHQDNSDDAVRKGRVKRGESHPRCKLTEAQVAMIRTSEQSGADLAREFGVSPSTISGIRTYRHR